LQSGKSLLSFNCKPFTSFNSQIKKVFDKNNDCVGLGNKSSENAFFNMFGCFGACAKPVKRG